MSDELRQRNASRPPASGFEFVAEGSQPHKKCFGVLEETAGGAEQIVNGRAAHVTGGKCMFATEETTPTGKIVKRYKHRDVKTPLECLALLSTKGLVELKRGITLEQLQAQAASQTDLAAAKAMQRAKIALFAMFNAKAAPLAPPSAFPTSTLSPTQKPKLARRASGGLAGARSP